MEQPSNTASSTADYSTVVSVVENRSREICICKMDANQMSQLDIYLLNDTHGYAETIATLRDIASNEILLHDGSKQRILTNKIQARFTDSAEQKVVFISRQYFDQDRGADLLKKVMAGDHSVDSELIAKYTVLAGAHCLLRYMENFNGTTFAPQTLRINYCSSCVAKMHIDRHTIAHLELLQSSSLDRDQPASRASKNSLFGVVNHTKTSVGSRLLRSSIMQPSADKTTIDMRLDTVDMLRTVPVSTQGQLSSVLKQLPDLDKMLTGIVVVPKNVTTKTAKYSIDTCIMIKQVLRQGAELATIIDGFNTNRVGGAPMTQNGNGHGDAPEYAVNNDLLHIIACNLKQPVFSAILDTLDEMLTESTHYSKSAAEMRHTECFAVKPGINGLLDVARKTYLQSVEDVYELAKQYSAALNANTATVGEDGVAPAGQPLVDIKVSFSTTRGYILVIPNTVNPLPAGFIQAVLNKKTISCTTTEVASLSDRAKEAIEQALLTTYTLLQEHMLGTVRAAISSMFSMVDSLAMFDMLNSFAVMVQHSVRQAAHAQGTSYTADRQPPLEYTRPIIVEEGPLIIHNGRHPIVAAARAAAAAKRQPTRAQGASASANAGGGAVPFQSNNTLLSSLSNMHVITGCNGAGKTIYIKQVALILVLAHIGCYIPAGAGSVIPIRDRILSRLGSEDDIEHNLSSFMVEMREVAYICEQVTPRSFILLDEVGRGTSNHDGIALAFAIVEHLLHISGCYTLCVTHFTQLAALAHLYCNVRNLHLKTVVYTPETVLPASNTTAYPGSSSGDASLSADVGTALMYTHALSEGLCDVPSGYGIIIAEVCGVPHEVIQRAYESYAEVKRLFPMYLEVVPVCAPVQQCYVLLQKLDLVFQVTRCTRDNAETTCRHLQSIRAHCTTDEISECVQLLEELRLQLPRSDHTTGTDRSEPQHPVHGPQTHVSPVALPVLTPDRLVSAQEHPLMCSGEQSAHLLRLLEDDEDDKLSNEARHEHGSRNGEGAPCTGGAACAKREACKDPVQTLKSISPEPKRICLSGSDLTTPSATRVIDSDAGEDNAGEILIRCTDTCTLMQDKSECQWEGEIRDFTVDDFNLTP